MWNLVGEYTWALRLRSGKPCHFSPFVPSWSKEEWRKMAQHKKATQDVLGLYASRCYALSMHQKLEGKLIIARECIKLVNTAREARIETDDTPEMAEKFEV
jgi:hypothetical protein